MKKTILVAVAFLYFSRHAGADPWTGKGQTWSHAGGITLVVPQDAKIDSDAQDDSIQIRGKSEDYFVGGHYTTDQAEADSRVNKLRNFVNDAKPTWAKALDVTTDNFEWFGQDASGTVDDKGVEFKVGYLTKKGKYFVFLASYPADAKLDGVVSGLLQSLRFP